MPKTEKPLTPKERKEKKLAEERRARKRAELEAIMASDNPPKIRVYRVRKPYKNGWYYVYEKQVVHVKLLGEDSTVELSSILIGKLPPGERDLNKMIPTGDTGPKGAMKRRRAEESGEPLYKEQQKSTEPQTSGASKAQSSAATTSIQEDGEETKPSAADIKRIDARDPSRVKYPMHWFIFVVLWCYLQGMTSCIQIAASWNSNYEFLSSRFPDFPKYKISHDTVLRLIKLIGRFKLWSILRLFTDHIIAKIEDLSQNKDIDNNNFGRNINDSIFNKNIFPIDGKAFRASPVKPGGNKRKYVLNLFNCKHRLVVEVVLVGDKTNEIPHCVDVIDGINIGDGVVTTDALNSTGALSREITNRGGDYCFAIKENYKGIYSNLCELFKKYENSDLMKYAETRDKGHGRIEDRQVYVLPAYLLEEDYQEHWSGLKHGSIVMNVQRRLEITKDIKSTETRYFITSLSYDSNKIAEFLMHVIRSHWGIENKYHYVLDVSFNQDRIQCKNGHFILGESILNGIAANLASAARRRLELRENREVYTPEIQSIAKNLDQYIGILHENLGEEFIKEMGIVERKEAVKS